MSVPSRSSAGDHGRNGHEWSGRSSGSSGSSALPAPRDSSPRSVRRVPRAAAASSVRRSPERSLRLRRSARFHCAETIGQPSLARSSRAAASGSLALPDRSDDDDSETLLPLPRHPSSRGRFRRSRTTALQRRPCSRGGSARALLRGAPSFVGVSHTGPALIWSGRASPVSARAASNCSGEWVDRPTKALAAGDGASARQPARRPGRRERRPRRVA